MKERVFRFKRFSVKHEKSAMKVGVDGVLTGAWVTCRGTRFLDVGTGCGMIALMLAQRNGEAVIDAIDIDGASVEEARENVVNSEWADRINVKNISFEDMLSGGTGNCYDVIVSNPPFFDSGVKDPKTPREKSRHQAGLSPVTLVREGKKLLKKDGFLSLIAPAEEFGRLIESAKSNGLEVTRVCFVRDNPTTPEKRVLMEFSNTGADSVESEDTMPTEKDMEHKRPCVAPGHLIMFDASGAPTPEYRRLCRNFYLKF